MTKPPAAAHEAQSTARGSAAAGAFTAAQLRERRGYLGASEVATALGLDRWQTPWELWHRKRGSLPPQESTPQMELGMLLERPLVEYAERHTGERAAPGGEHRIPDSPIVAHPDGRFVESGRVLEAKTAAVFNRWADLSAWGDPGEPDPLPIGVVIQCQMQMAATGLRGAVVPALLGDRGLALYDLERDEVVIAEVVRRASAWWQRHMIDGEEPDPTQAPLEELGRIQRAPGKRVTVDDDVFLRAFMLRNDRLDAEKAEAEAKKALLAAMGDAEIADSRYGTFTMAERRRSAFNQRRFTEDHPDLAREYTDESTYRAAQWKVEE